MSRGATEEERVLGSVKRKARDLRSDRKREQKRAKLGKRRDAWRQISRENKSLLDAKSIGQNDLESAK